MQAVVQGAYGGPDRLRLSEVEAPSLAPDSVLVRMHASSVNMGGRLMMRGMPYIIDRTFALSEATEAIGYLESGRHRGKVVISTVHS